MGRVVGQIAREPFWGATGFHFDPVMGFPHLARPCPVAHEVKNANSHRGRAAQAMAALIRANWMDQ